MRRQQEVEGQSGKTVSVETSASRDGVTCVGSNVRGWSVSGVRSGFSLSLPVCLQFVSAYVYERHLLSITI